MMAGGSEPFYGSSLADTQQIVSADCVISNWNFKISKAPGAGKSWTYVMMVNGAASAMTITIADTATTGSYAGSLALSAGDLISIRCTPAGTPPSATYGIWAFDLECTAGEEYSLFPVHTWGPWNYDLYMGVSVGYAIELFDPAEAYVVMPMAGTFKSLWVKIDTAPGAGKSWKWTLYKNGSDTGLSVTISDTATSGYDLVNEVDVMPGDLLCWHVVGTGSPAYHNADFCVAFASEVPGWYPAMYQADYLPYADDYQGIRGGGGNSGAHTDVCQLANRCRIRGMTAWLSEAPAAGEAWTAELYVNQVATGIKAVLTTGMHVKTVEGVIEIAQGAELTTRWTDQPHWSTDGPQCVSYIVDASE